MINLDQVRTLEWKVKQAVQLIVQLRRENDTLRSRLSDTEVRLQELESFLESFKATQSEMESGIRNALEDLDNLENGGHPSAPVSGPVDLVDSPPAEGAFATDEPSALFEKVSPHGETVVVIPEPSFDEEYAALAAAEAEDLVSSAIEETEVPLVDAAPESVELEEALPGETEAEPEPSVPEERQPEQPGLGIF